MSAGRLSFTFHETFALNLPAVGQVLSLAAESDELLTTAKIRAKTYLGSRFVNIVPRYLRGCGLLGFGNYFPTRFGNRVRQCDPNLAQPTTLWLMHYHMSAPHGPGPEYWSHLITSQLPFGRDVSAADLRTALRSLLTLNGGSEPQQTSIESSVSAFTSTYLRSDGLGRLGLLRETGRTCNGGKSYLVSGPQTPPTAVVAYALADYWEANYQDRQTVGLSDLASRTGFARVMWMDQAQLDKALDALRLAGVLDLYKVAPPYQVVRLWSDKADLLERLYQ